VNPDARVGLIDLVAVDPVDPEFANLGRSLAGSRDGGVTWRALLPAKPSPENFDASAVTFASSDPRRVYAAGITSVGIGHGREPALYRSLDRGVSWTGTNAFGDIRALAVDPAPSRGALRRGARSVRHQPQRRGSLAARRPGPSRHRKRSQGPPANPETVVPLFCRSVRASETTPSSASSSMRAATI